VKDSIIIVFLFPSCTDIVKTRSYMVFISLWKGAWSLEQDTTVLLTGSINC